MVPEMVLEMVLEMALEMVLEMVLEMEWCSSELIPATKLLKAALGLNSYCRNSALLQALNIQSVSKSTEIQELVLFRSMFLSSSRSSTFYKFLQRYC